MVLNLAEGFGRRTRRDQSRVFAIAFGSIREVEAILEILAVRDPEIPDLLDHASACIYRLLHHKLDSQKIP